MILNVNNTTNAYFDGISSGECFAYNGSYYIMAHDAAMDKWFGVNLSDGIARSFDNSCRVQKLTAEVNFKELS